MLRNVARKQSLTLMPIEHGLRRLNLQAELPKPLESRDHLNGSQPNGEQACKHESARETELETTRDGSIREYPQEQRQRAYGQRRVRSGFRVT